MKHAGIHWPANADGEHPDVATILGMPGVSNGCTLITAESARFWYRQARAASPLVVWRAIPRAYEHKLPAHLGWDAKRVADECLNLWDEQKAAHTGTEWFLPLNELQFERENGAPFPGYLAMANNLRRLRLELRQRFVGTGVKLMFPAWVPQDDGDRLNEWHDEAEQWDGGICLHAYGSAKTMRTRYQSYRDAFPGKPLFVGEWNSNHEGHDERESLEMWADVASADPLFLGATYYIWETNNAGERDLSIWGNPTRLDLFSSPPTVSLPIPPVEPPVMNRDEIITLIAAKAHERGLVPYELLGGAIAESGLDPKAERWGTPPDVSFGLFQQTVRFANEGDHSDSPENTALIQRLYEDPVHACDVAAAKFKAYRTKEATALDAWCRYNWPAKTPADNPNRSNYASGLDQALLILGAVPMPTPLPYNPDAPCDVQPDDWSCSVQSTQWLLRSIGRNPADAWMEQQLVPSIVSKDVGLLDASGAQLAAWINREYGAEMGFTASASPVTFDDVLAGAGVNPTIVGGRHYGPGGHWVGIRRHDEDGLLEMANPAPNYTGTGTHLDRTEWDARGPWSAIYIDRGAVAPPPPVPVPVPQPTRAHVLVDEIRARLDELANLVA